MANVKYFNGEIELNNVRSMDNKDFAEMFPGVRGLRYDSFTKWIGFNNGGVYPVERMITYKSNPSKHKCNSRCLHASGRNMDCQCECGGKNHGRLACV